MSNHEEIKNNILEQLQKIKEEKLSKKYAKSNAKRLLEEENRRIKKERMEEKKLQTHQERYRNKQKEEGMYQIQSFLHSSQVEKIDNYICNKAKEKIKINRSDVIAKAIEIFFLEHNKD